MQVCVCVFCVSSVCIKRAKCVIWYSVPMCHVVCGLFVSLCTGPQGRTLYIRKQLSAVLPKMRTHCSHAVESLCKDACGCSAFSFVLCWYAFILHMILKGAIRHANMFCLRFHEVVIETLQLFIIAVFCNTKTAWNSGNTLQRLNATFLNMFFMCFYQCII